MEKIIGFLKKFTYSHHYRKGTNDILKSIINQKKEKMVVIYETDDCLYTFTAKKHKNTN